MGVTNCESAVNIANAASVVFERGAEQSQALANTNHAIASARWMVQQAIVHVYAPLACTPDPARSAMHTRTQ